MLCQDGAEPMTRQVVQTRAKRAARKAGLSNYGVHTLVLRRALSCVICQVSRVLGALNSNRSLGRSQLSFWIVASERNRLPGRVAGGQHGAADLTRGVLLHNALQKSA